MDRTNLTFFSHPVQGNHLLPVYLNITLALTFLSIALFVESSWMTTILLLIGAGVSLYLGFIRPRRPYIRYELSSRELIIHSDRRELHLPFDSIKGVTVQSFWQRPAALIGEHYLGYAYGLFRLDGYEITLYATRFDRLVLLDTTEGLLGITPLAAEEDRLLAELVSRSGAVFAADGFSFPTRPATNSRALLPQHARRSGAIWPILLFTILVEQISGKFTSFALLQDSVWTWVPLLLGLLLVVLLYPSLFRLQQKQPWLFPALCAVGLAMLLFG